MRKTTAVSFKKSLSNFISPVWLSRSAASAERVQPIRSISDSPIDPIDAVFTTVMDNDQSPDHLPSQEAVTRQILARDALSHMIKLQAELSEDDHLIQFNARTAIEAYRTAHIGLMSLD